MRLLIVLLLLLPFYSQAAIKELKPGQVIELKPNEGLLLLNVDTHVPLTRVGIVGVGDTGGRYSIQKLSSGQTKKLLIADAGTYTWNELHLTFGYYKLKKSDNFDFKVTPGLLNYPGDLIYAREDYSSVLHRANRGLLLYDWYHKTYPQIAKKIPFNYAGDYPDPFYAFMDKENATGIYEGKSKPLPKTPVLPLSIEKLWKQHRVADAWLSPDANYIVEEINGKSQTLEVIDRKSGHVVKAGSYAYIDELTWLNDKTFVVTYGGSYGHRSGSVHVSISTGSDGKVAATNARIARSGFVLNPLRNDPDYFLYAADSNDDYDRTLIMRLPKNAQEKLADNQFMRSQVMYNSDKQDNIRRWITNGEGEIIAMVKEVNGKYIFQKRSGKQFIDVAEIGEDEDGIWPLAMSRDGTRVFALSAKIGGQRDLITVSATDLKDPKVVFSVPGKDIYTVSFDSNREPIAARYYSDGVVTTEYFDKVAKDTQARLARTFPGQNIIEISRAVTPGKSLLIIDGSNNPGGLYYFDKQANEISKIDDMASWLDSKMLSEAHVVKAKSTDGFEIEGYLTLPRNNTNEKPPLIVVPHGGPVGVRDYRHFDPEAQFLSSLGYAVLKVNYRGSEGFGTAFLKAGKGSFGTRIEDDVELVVNQVIKAGNVDSSRMCILGTSYGGYSALVAITRANNRYRCAVSISGVTDRLMQFTASDSVLIPGVRKEMADYFGDPLTELEKIKQVQPVYNYKSIRVPVMLVHGTNDFRVDYENSLRMQRLLTMSGNDGVMLTFKGGKHGLQTAEEERIAWEAIAGFLAMHLNASTN